MGFRVLKGLTRVFSMGFRRVLYGVQKCFRSNISNTRDAVSSGYQNTKTKVKITDVQRSIFDDILGVWIADETLF